MTNIKSIIRQSGVRQYEIADYLHMKHLTKVGKTAKLIQRKYVRVGEGTLIYNIGRHRFIEMARAAGAVYKIGDSKGSKVLVRLDIFDEYMEQFREKPVEMKHPLWKED